MKKIYILILLTVALIVALYCFGFQKSSESVMDWKSFKINTKYFLGLILGYAIALYLLYRK